MSVAARAKKVRLALMDIDGVLTNGWIFHFVDTAGGLVEFKGVHAQDSIALSWLAQCGIKTGFISGRQSRGMEERLKLVKASYIYQGRLDKKNVLEEICRDAGVSADEALYMGDDLPDVPVLKSVGLAAAPANARPEVKAAAHLVTRRAGGEGAVRELVELVLKAQGHWDGLLKRFEVSVTIQRSKTKHG
ncbi:MAG: HAD hydrolase family protein [Elusimicrobia bacterium]|nr:HAD hydrolase family protein [Elusimicrobiota bacterium]